MKNKIKCFLKKTLGNKLFMYRERVIDISKIIYHDSPKIIGLFKSIKKVRIYQNHSKSKTITKLLENVEIDNNISNNFYYKVDFFKTINSSKAILDNLSIDYSLFLEHSLEDLENEIKTKESNGFYDEEIILIEAIKSYLQRIQKNLRGKNQKIQKNLNAIITTKAQSFHDALQRILFFNMLLWQTNHQLNGLGRLDQLLIQYYLNDIENKVLTREEARNLLKEFLLLLHQDYQLKSNTLFGDTGQIIELGGINKKGEYLSNELTYLFIDLMKELQIPDPKLLVRASHIMPKQVMEKSLECIITGIGCPLFANDDVIIDKLIQFGYDQEDAYNYGTSACWEPYIIGKSSAQNNIKSLNFMIPFNHLLAKEDLNTLKTMKDIVKKYKIYLKEWIESLCTDLSKVSFEQDPLLSLCIQNCIEEGKDISLGSAKYNDFGLTSVGLSNLINSLINIDEFVFKRREISLLEFNRLRNENFNDDSFVKKMKNNSPRFGQDDSYVISLTNEIITYTSDILKSKRNVLGGRYKFGLSSPNYINDSKKLPASFDGRRATEPFNVHISTESSNGYTELINFAGKLDYNDNRFNGNVVDFFVTPHFIRDNFNKFVDFLMASNKAGFFEMQMNVVDSKQLIEARKNPEKFPHLIVRVWGFSAYFNELPDEYKDYLIERALKNEGHC